MKNPPRYHLVGYRADGRRVNRRYRRLEPALAMQQKMPIASMSALFTVPRGEPNGDGYWKPAMTIRFLKNQPVALP